jgi:hypothetical protein
MVARKHGVVIPAQFEDLEPLTEDRCLFLADGKWGLLAVPARILVPAQYEGVDRARKDRFGGEFIDVQTRGRWGLLDVENGTEVLACQYSAVDRWGQLYLVRSGKTSGIFSSPGKGSAFQSVTDLNLDVVPSYGYLVNGYGCVERKGKSGLLGMNGKIRIECQYDELGLVSEGLVPVSIDGRWGFVDLDGNTVIPLRFEDAKSFSEGLAAVKIKGKYGFIDRAGKIAVRPSYSDAGYCYKGLIPVAASEAPVGETGRERWGLLDRSGAPVLPIEYDFIEWPSPVGGMGRLHGRIGWAVR